LSLVYLTSPRLYTSRTFVPQDTEVGGHVDITGFVDGKRRFGGDVVAKMPHKAHRSSMQDGHGIKGYESTTRDIETRKGRSLGTKRE